MTPWLVEGPRLAAGPRFYTLRHCLSKITYAFTNGAAPRFLGFYTLNIRLQWKVAGWSNKNLRRDNSRNTVDKPAAGTWEYSPEIEVKKQWELPRVADNKLDPHSIRRNKLRGTRGDSWRGKEHVKGRGRRRGNIG